MNLGRTIVAIAINGVALVAGPTTKKASAEPLAMPPINNERINGIVPPPQAYNGIPSIAANGIANHSPGLNREYIHLPGIKTSMKDPRIIPISR